MPTAGTRTALLTYRFHNNPSIALWVHLLVRLADVESSRECKQKACQGHYNAYYDKNVCKMASFKMEQHVYAEKTQNVVIASEASQTTKAAYNKLMPLHYGSISHYRG